MNRNAVAVHPAPSRYSIVDCINKQQSRGKDAFLVIAPVRSVAAFPVRYSIVVLFIAMVGDGFQLVALFLLLGIRGQLIFPFTGERIMLQQHVICASCFHLSRMSQTVQLYSLCLRIDTRSE